MVTDLVVPLVCWLCALIALPRVTRVGQSAEERTYARRLGGQRRLIFVAIVVTALALARLDGTSLTRIDIGSDRATSVYLPCADSRVRENC